MKAYIKQTHNVEHSTTYEINQQVLKKQIKPDKLGAKRTRSYNIDQIHTHDTITISLCSGVTEPSSIKRVMPCQKNN